MSSHCRIRGIGILQVENDANYECLLGFLSLIHHPVNKLDIQACLEFGCLVRLNLLCLAMMAGRPCEGG